MPLNCLFPQLDQPLLLPVDIREWLSEYDLAFLVNRADPPEGAD